MKLIACRELGFQCAFVADGETPREAEHHFWLHARVVHGRQLRRLSVDQKAAITQLVEDLAHSGRLNAVVSYHRVAAPRHEDVSVRRWWR